LWLVDQTVSRLPQREIRTRYEREFTAELYGITPTRQLRHCLGLLGTSTALRSTLRGGQATVGEIVMTLARPSKPLLCRLNIRHHWVIQRHQDREAFYTCTRCGKDRLPGVTPIGSAT
jgi:hypothetical protein